MNSEMLAIAYGLGSALTWGAGDFSGGFATKKGHVLAVIFFSQIVGASLLLALQLSINRQPWAPADLIWGGLAGLSGAFGLVALYKGLASGRMGLVAPVSGVISALIPIVFSFFLTGWPRDTQLTGFGIGLAAVWLLSASGSGEAMNKKELKYAWLAGVGFGCFLICLNRASSQNVIAPLLAARIASVTVIGLILARRRRLAWPEKGQFPYLLLTGVLDTVGNAFFALSAQLGRLDVAALLASMYPAATVMLACGVLKERLRRTQWFGVVAALLALLLISA